MIVKCRSMFGEVRSTIGELRSMIGGWSEFGLRMSGMWVEFGEVW